MGDGKIPRVRVVFSQGFVVLSRGGMRAFRRAGIKGVRVVSARADREGKEKLAIARIV